MKFGYISVEKLNKGDLLNEAGEPIRLGDVLVKLNGEDLPEGWFAQAANDEEGWIEYLTIEGRDTKENRVEGEVSIEILKS